MAGMGGAAAGLSELRQFGKHAQERTRTTLVCENHWRYLSADLHYVTAKNRPAAQAKLGVEAPGGFEPPHRSFADCSLSHLGTAPLEGYSTGL
jgi:hypothetical protein